MALPYTVLFDVHLTTEIYSNWNVMSLIISTFNSAEVLAFIKKIM